MKKMTLLFMLLVLSMANTFIAACNNEDESFTEEETIEFLTEESDYENVTDTIAEDHCCQ